MSMVVGVGDVVVISLDVALRLVMDPKTVPNHSTAYHDDFLANASTSFFNDFNAEFDSSFLLLLLLLSLSLVKGSEFFDDA